jgi:hypothetical protein
VKIIKIFYPKTFFSACILGLFELPSGAKYCRVRASIKKTAPEAHEFCKTIGLSGLLEFNSTEDVVKVAGINACKKHTKAWSYQQKYPEKLAEFLSDF